ncbi:MAG: hypothetical protein Q9N02_04100, partial [Ghiorsea sp.]|nr:hypothetical protein [Ghiorsea sp.]
MTFKLSLPYVLQRRGMHLGDIVSDESLPMPDSQTIIAAWKKDQALVLPKLLKDSLPDWNT